MAQGNCKVLFRVSWVFVCFCVTFAQSLSRRPDKIVLLKEPSQLYVSEAIHTLLSLVQKHLNTSSYQESYGLFSSKSMNLELVTDDCRLTRTSLAVHLTYACLPVHQQNLSLPVVSVPGTRQNSVDYLSLLPRLSSFVQVVNAIAQQSEWNFAAYIGDEDWDFELLNGLMDAGSSLQVQTIVGIANNLQAEKVAHQLLSLTIDVILVHCSNESYLNIVKKIYVLISGKSEVPWLVTGTSAGKILTSNLQDVISDKAMPHPPVIGIERAVLVSDASSTVMKAVQSLGLTSTMDKVDLLYVYDAILVAAHMLLSGDREGVQLVSYLNELNIEGTSGQIQFENSSLERIGGVYDVVYTNPVTYSVLTIGTYDVTHSHWLHELRIPTVSHLYPTAQRRLKRQMDSNWCDPVTTGHFRVTTLEEPPFVMKDENGTSGEDRSGIFYGFLVDMMNLLAEPNRLNFTYTMSEPPDRLFGSIDERAGHATGMIGRLLNCSDDLAVASLTITAERQKYLDLTKPFLDIGLSLLATKASPEKPGLWAFLDPFDRWTWICIVVSCIVCAVCLVVLHRLSPYGRRTIEQSDGLPFTFKIHNSLWFFYTSFMQQGPEGAAFLSGKVLLGGWFFFCLITVATYTANLAAFLTVKSFPEGIETVDQLSRQTKVQYGTVVETGVFNFFKNSPIDTYRNMYNYMSSTDGVMVQSSVEGINQVKNSNPGEYVFIWDRPVLEYFAGQLPCTSEVVGTVFNSGGYGIAMPHHMPYLEDFSLAILELRDEGKIEQLTRKWLKTGACSGASSSTDDATEGEEANISQMAGVFVLLCIAIGVSVVVAVIERRVWLHKTSRKQILGLSVENEYAEKSTVHLDKKG